MEYLRPVNLQHEIFVEGRETEQKGRNIFMAGEIRNEAGDVLARGKGRFVVIGDYCESEISFLLRKSVNASPISEIVLAVRVPIRPSFRAL